MGFVALCGAPAVPHKGTDPQRICVENMEIELREYVRADGKCPFRDWLRTLKDANTRAKIRVRLNRIRNANMEDCKSVGTSHIGSADRSFLSSSPVAVHRRTF